MDDLEMRINKLELLQRQQTEDLKQSFHEFGQSISPANIMKGVMKSVVTAPGLRTTVLDTIISSGAGLLGNKLVTRNSGNIFRKIAGKAFQFVISNVVRNKMPSIKENIVHHNHNGANK
jgi:hypothetical protein